MLNQKGVALAANYVCEKLGIEQTQEVVTQCIKTLTIQSADFSDLSEYQVVVAIAANEGTLQGFESAPNDSETQAIHRLADCYYKTVIRAAQRVEDNHEEEAKVDVAPFGPGDQNPNPEEEPPKEESEQTVVEDSVDVSVDTETPTDNDNDVTSGGASPENTPPQ